MSTTGIIFAMLASITWGAVYTIDQKILTNMSPILWLAISTFVTAILMLPVIFFNLEEVRAVLHSGKSNLLFIFSAQVLIAVATFLIFSSIKHLGAATASVFEITYPFFVIIFSLLMFGGSVNAYFWLGSALIFLGAVVITKFS
ncbi:MAG: hypothetical protein C0412_07990 [Flavobacterium sp.]|nr:hypothetical protein [Flavobacterium sp.]